MTTLVEQDFSPKASTLYINGLKQLMIVQGITLEQARREALEDVIGVDSDHSIPFIELAYQFLLANPDYVIE